MKIKSVEFAGAIGQIGQQAPESARGMPQVAFSGRSNVGKSSLINRLLGRTRTAIARVSQEPGKTQEINFYRVRSDLGDFFLVDLPGYGYARVPHDLRKKWEGVIHAFLSSTTDLVGVVQLIDLRTGPSPDDLRSVDYLAELRLPVLFALTKADKLGATKRKEAFLDTVRKLEIDPDQAIAFSALKGDGRDELLDTLASLLFPATDATGSGDDVDASGDEGGSIDEGDGASIHPAADVDAADADAADVDPSDVDASDVDASDLDVSDVDEADAEDGAGRPPAGGPG